VQKALNFALWSATAMLGAACTFGLWHAAAMIPLQVPLDPNEGWNAYHTIAAMQGGALYPARGGGGMVNNYPPLSFYAVGLVTKIVGDPIVAGRMLSLLSLLFICGAILRIARDMGAERAAGVFAALWFLGGLLAFTDYVAMDDPQLFGHAIDLAGLILLLRGRAGPAALAMTLALFVKHNLLALPLASLLWLALIDRRQAAHFALYGSVSGVVGLMLFRWTFGIGLLGALATPRIFSLALLAQTTATWLIWCATAMAAAMALLWTNRTDRNVVFGALYALVAVTVAAAFSGGAGVDLNVWFDAAIALSLCAALALTRMTAPLQRALLLAAYLVPLLTGLVLAADESWRDPQFWLHPGRDDAQTARSDIAFLNSHRGPALCEMLSLCYWAGKPAEVDTFNLGQAFATGARSDRQLAARIAAGQFAVLQFDALDDFALGPRVKAALLRRYRVHHQDDDGVLMLPR